MKYCGNIDVVPKSPMFPLSGKVRDTLMKDWQDKH